MQYKVSVGSPYTVTAAAEDCVVTDAAGRIIATVKPGKQYSFTASTATVELSDAAAALTANFNSAPAGSAAAGGLSEENLVEFGLLETVTFTASEEVLAAARAAGQYADCCGFSLAAADADLYFDCITVYYLGASEEHTLKITKYNDPKVYTSVRTVVGDNCAQFFFEKKLNFRFVVSMTIEGGRPFKSYEASTQLSTGLASAAWLEPAGDYSLLFPRFSLSCDKEKQSYKPTSARQYVTIQVRGVKKVDESFYGELDFWRYSTSATGWRIIDPQGPLVDWQVDCGVNCEPGWLYRELWERPSATGETDVTLVGWEFVLLAGEEEFLLRNVREFASVLSDATGGVNTLHYKVIYHD